MSWPNGNTLSPLDLLESRGLPRDVNLLSPKSAMLYNKITATLRPSAPEAEQGMDSEQVTNAVEDSWIVSAIRRHTRSMRALNQARMMPRRHQLRRAIESSSGEKHVRSFTSNSCCRLSPDALLRQGRLTSVSFPGATPRRY